MDNKMSEEIWPALSSHERDLIKSQMGPLSAMPFIALPRACSSCADSTSSTPCPHAHEFPEINHDVTDSSVFFVKASPRARLVSAKKKKPAEV